MYGSGKLRSSRVLKLIFRPSEELMNYGGDTLVRYNTVQYRAKVCKDRTNSGNFGTHCCVTFK